MSHRSNIFQDGAAVGLCEAWICASQKHEKLLLSYVCCNVEVNRSAKQLAKASGRQLGSVFSFTVFLMLFASGPHLAPANASCS